MQYASKRDQHRDLFALKRQARQAPEATRGRQMHCRSSASMLLVFFGQLLLSLLLLLLPLAQGKHNNLTVKIAYLSLDTPFIVPFLSSITGIMYFIIIIIISPPTSYQNLYLKEVLQLGLI
ncbi:hypothetical protein T09_3014 [Trichinella sp. T9]|nr:hypothetical protein T09_3014 [Trichinella sp. T9]